MFEWLELELAAVKTPRFHLVDGPAKPELREAIARSSLSLPESYKEFVLRFGNARLYRRARNDSYLIRVYAGPRDATLGDGTPGYEIGFHDDMRVFIQPAKGGTGGAVWEYAAGSQEMVGEDFGEWLAESCASARGQYGAETWADILRGPKPFTPEEEEAIATRRQISRRVVGIDAEGNHVFEIHNASTRRIPVLTVGVRSRDRRLNGAVRLKIGHVGPGQTAAIHADCYKELMAPEEIEAFGLPDPRPEDREFYGELNR